MKKQLITMLLATAVFAGCASAPVAEPLEQTGGKTLVYGSSDYTAINPALYEHGEINSLIFNGLTAHDAKGGVVPCLAESWEYDEAAKTYTFHLRPGVLWHDGEPFTAEDVKFTLEAIMNPANGSEIASNYEEVERVEAAGAETVRIILKQPNVALLEYLTVGVLPKHLLEGKDLITDGFNQSPVGTGPYKLQSWDIGQSITLVKHENYFAKTPQIDTIVFKIVEDMKTRALQLKSGELTLSQVTPHDAEAFKNDGKFAFYDMKTADYRGILYNFNNPFWQKNRALPNAISYGVDRQAIVDSVLLGYGYAAYSPLQAGDYVDETMERFDYDPARAKAAIEAAGWTMGAGGVYEKDGQKLSFSVNCREGDQVRIDMASVAAQQLKAVGVDMNVEIVAKVDWANQDAYLIGWGSPFDPDDHTYKVFGSDKGSNYSGYSNAEADRLLLAARETDDDAARHDLYAAFQQEIAKDMPYTFLAYIDALYVGDGKLHGIAPETVLGHHGVGIFWNVADWSLEE